MAGTNRIIKEGALLEGKLGKYRLKKCIGSGGNSVVFSVEIIERNDDSLLLDQYVIKVLTFRDNRSPQDRQKRIARFRKEVHFVSSVSGMVTGIIPVFDGSFGNSGDNEYEWYLMPKAEACKFSRTDSLDRKLESLIELGKIIEWLHNAGYAHRDIKPANILVYQGKLCLSDFGLIWEEADAEHITGEHEPLGPIKIRPPEMEAVILSENIDYKKSDVYLFAKTVWIALSGNATGFRGEYSRKDDQIYLSKERFRDVLTLEPIHKAMELATKHNYADRPDITEILMLLNLQLQIVRHRISDDIILSLQYQEASKHVEQSIEPDHKTYCESTKVAEFLNALVGTSELVVYEFGQEISLGHLKAVRHLGKNVFSLSVVRPNMQQYRSSSVKYWVTIKELRTEDDQEYTFSTSTFSEGTLRGKECNNLKELLQSPDKELTVNTELSITVRALKRG